MATADELFEMVLKPTDTSGKLFVHTDDNFIEMAFIYRVIMEVAEHWQEFYTDERYTARCHYCKVIATNNDRFPHTPNLCIVPRCIELAKQMKESK